MSYAEHKIIVKYEKGASALGTMIFWCGRCTCGTAWQFHFFGAALGYGLEHQRRGYANG